MTNQIIGQRRLGSLLVSGLRQQKPEQVVKELGAMQAQDYMQVVWAIGLRTGAGTLSDIQAAILDRKIVLTWALRGTIHCVPAEDVKWMTQLVASRILGSAKRRLEQLGLDDETLTRSRKIIYDALKGHRQVTRPSLMQQLEDAGIRTDNQRGYHILWSSAYQGLICFGPMSGKQQTFVLVDEWVPNAREQSFEESMAELALRYFKSHGPSTLQDFAWWTGTTLTDSRRALDAVKDKLQFEIIAGTDYWFSEAQPYQANEHEEDICLLSGFDEFILGYKDRSAVLSPEIAPRIVPGNNGIFLPTLVAGGKVVGTWKRNIKKKGIEISIHPFESIDGKEEGLQHAVERFASFLEMPILKLEINASF